MSDAHVVGARIHLDMGGEVPDFVLIDGMRVSRAIQCDKRGTCIVCYDGCDTEVALRGSRKWLTEFLAGLGVDDAGVTMNYILSQGAAPDATGRIGVLLTLCRRCATAASPAEMEIKLSNRYADTGGPSYVEKVPTYTEEGLVIAERRNEQTLLENAQVRGHISPQP